MHTSSDQSKQLNGPQMSDRDRLTDVLSTEKQLLAGLNTATIESSGTQLHQLQLQLLNETHQAQRQVFNLMHQRGWYKLEAAPTNDVVQKAQQFTEYQTQIPY